MWVCHRLLPPVLAVGAAWRAVRESTVRVRGATLWDWLSLGRGASRKGAAACLTALGSLLSLLTPNN
jgi:hypothetical protein